MVVFTGCSVRGKAEQKVWSELGRYALCEPEKRQRSLRAMIAVDYKSVKKDFRKYCEAATRDFETIVVTREKDENVIVISESEYNNLKENLYVRENEYDYARLRASIAQLRRGEGSIRTLADDE